MIRFPSLSRTLSAALVAAGSLLLASSYDAAAQACKPQIADALLMKPGHLTMVTSPTLPPMAYADPDGTLRGLRIEIGYEIAKRLCLKPEYIRAEYAVMIPGLKSGRWDMVNAGLFVTPERRKILHMIAYESLALSISTDMKNSGSITKVDDLAGKTVSTDIGGYAEVKIKQLNAEFKQRGMPEMNIKLFDGYATVYQALRAGQVQAAVSIDPVSKQYQDRGEFAQALSGLYATPGSLSFGNKDIADAVSKALKEMKADGFFDALMKKYGVLPAPGNLDVLPQEG